MKIIRLTEEDLGNMIKASLRGAVNEDVLGDNWHENDDSDDTEDSDVMNNYPAIVVFPQCPENISWNSIFIT